MLRSFGQNPPPHVGGYISQTRSESFFKSARWFVTGVGGQSPAIHAAYFFSNLIMLT